MKKLFNAMLALVLIVMLARASQARTYNSIDLDYPGQGNYISSGRGINNKGLISGSYGTESDNNVGFWNDGLTYNNFIIDGYTTLAVGINDAGLIVGKYNTDAYIFNTVNKTYETFRIPGALGTSFFGINNFSQIVGFYTDSSSHTHGIICNMTTGQYSQLDYPEAKHTYAFGINDSGIVVGCYNDGVTDHGFIYDGIFLTCDYPSSEFTRAAGINDFGQIVGRFKYNKTDTGSHGFIFDKGIFTLV